MVFPTTDRILFFIKTHGPVSTATLARKLDLTSEAARQQVQKLVAAGLVEAHVARLAAAEIPPE